ncbi:hypothetical protein ABR36_01510 [Enterobacter ludwigii]|nr:hypothetical protein ABR36_01510 [Enterobacter ludwigii]
MEYLAKKSIGFSDSKDELEEKRKKTNNRKLLLPIVNSKIEGRPIIMINEAPQPEEGKSGTITVTPHSFQDKFKLAIPLAIFSGGFNEKIKGEIVDLIMEKYRIIYTPWSFLDRINGMHSPELTFIFLSRMDIIFKLTNTNGTPLDDVIKDLKIPDRTVVIDVTLTIVMYPLYPTRDHCNNHAYLDYNHVRHMTYKSVATGNWNTKKYSKLYYLTGTTSGKGGGHYIGMNDVQSDFNIAKDNKDGFILVSSRPGKDGLCTQLFIKHIDTGTKKNFDKSSLSRIKNILRSKNIGEALQHIASQDKNINDT